MTGLRRRSEWLLVTLLVVDCALCLFVILARVRFPFELEWMTGSTLDHVERVRLGLPIYSAPSADWIPFLYPPLYYGVASLFAKGFLGCRVLSIAAAATQAVCIGSLARALGASRFWQWVAVGFFVACFPYVGWWYDIERSDTLFVALMLSGVTVLVCFPGVLGAASAGLILGAGFFAKQPALLFVAGAIVGLAAKRQLRQAAALLVASGAVFAIGTWWLERQTGGWFHYYAFTIPRAHGIQLALVPDVLLRDFPLGFLLLGATAAALPLVRRASREQMIFATALGAAFVAGVGPRLHIGGWVNVLQPWTSFACIAVALLGTAADRAGERRALLVRLAGIIQLALWVYNPMDRLPRRGAQEANVDLHAKVASLETRGEVLFVGRGHVTRRRHFHFAALADVYMATGRTPDDLLAAIRERRFAAIIDDAHAEAPPPSRTWPPVALDQLRDLRPLLISSYRVAERLDDRFGTLAMIAPWHPRWVLVPRAEPLQGTPQELDRVWASELSR